MLKEAAPRVSRVAILMSTFAVEKHGLDAMKAAEPALGITAIPVVIDSPTQPDMAALLTRARADALYVFPNSINRAHSAAISNFAAENRLPTMYGDREFVEAGGLMSYWVNWLDLRRHAAVYVDKILKGAKPADLPVEGPTKFELVINLKTAKTPYAVLQSGRRVHAYLPQDSQGLTHRLSLFLAASAARARSSRPRKCGLPSPMCADAHTRGPKIA